MYYNIYKINSYFVTTRVLLFRIDTLPLPNHDKYQSGRYFAALKSYITSDEKTGTEMENNLTIKRALTKCEV